MRNKKLRIFAGPNGSGKSTFIQELQSHFNIGVLLNADNIQERLNSHGFLDYTLYVHNPINNDTWLNFLKNNKRPSSENLRDLIFTEFHIVIKKNINGYDAAIIADFLRLFLLEGEETFSFETVFSHSSKLELIKSAQSKGFKVYYYFLCTVDPKINMQRVVNRVIQGGHDVSQDKIYNRYYKSLELLYDAFKFADRAFIFDTTFGESDMIIEKKDNEILVHSDIIPTWVNDYLLKYFDK